MDKETFEMRRDWAKSNIDKCDKEIKDLEEKFKSIQYLLEVYKDEKKRYKEYLKETWEHHIKQE